MTSAAGGVQVWGCAVALVAAPMLVMVATGLDQTGADDTVAYLGQVAAARDRYLAAGLLLAVGMAAFLPAARGLALAGTQAGRSGLLRAGAWLLAAGAVFSGSAVTSGFAPAYEATSSVAPPSVAYVEALNSSPWAIMGFVGSGLALGVGLLITGIGLWRSGVVPRWAAAMCFAGPAGFVLPGDVPYDAVSWLLVAVPFGLAARELVRRSPSRRDRTSDGGVVVRSG